MSGELPIFLDYNSTTPCAPEVIESMLPYFGKNFGNPASKSHVYGGIAEEAVEQARESLAALISAHPREIIFTSGATEAINLALKGIAQSFINPHIISFSTEHKAVLDSLEWLQSGKTEVTCLAVNQHGLPDLEEIKNNIRKNTVMVCMMYANNETGTIMPVKEVGQICNKAGIHFFCDATQAIGKIPVDVRNDNITLLALSGHKFYGPKGIGALYLRSSSPKPTPLIHGGGHEHGLRSGTLNVPAIAGIGKAAELAVKLMPAESARQADLKKMFLKNILSIPGTAINGNPKQSLPNTCNIAFDSEGGEQLIRRISSRLAVSQGSACSSAITRPSHVLSAMGCSELQSFRSIRFSIGRPTTEEEISMAANIIQKSVSEIKF